MFEKSFPQSARPTLREISPEFGCRSPLRRPHPGEISHKVGRTSCRKPFSDTLWLKKHRDGDFLWDNVYNGMDYFGYMCIK